MRDWSDQNRANGERMLRELQGFGCHPVASASRADQFTAHCPFHADSTPSFSLNTKEGIFHCFGCGLSGHIHQFMHLLQAKGYKVDYRNILKKSQKQKCRRELKRKTELPLLNVDMRQLLACYEICIRHFHETLLCRPEYERLVREPYDSTFTLTTFNRETHEMESKEYTYTSPQFSLETAQRFCIGFSPPSDVVFVRDLRKQFPDEIILATGLFRRLAKNGIVCLLGGRVVYPYFVDGRPAYAIGRLTEYAPGHLAHAKYCKQKAYTDLFRLPLQNPPLFNADALKQNGTILITEGVTDAIKANEAGIPAISPVTIAFKKNSLNDIAQELGGKTVIVCNDNEASGIGANGAQRMMAELEARKVHTAPVVLPRRPDQQKVDVCSFIMEEGAEAFRSLIESQTGIRFPISPQPHE